MSFKFAHMSDCHLGSWSNHPELKEMSVLAFEKALDECIKEKADFALICGDLFDTALPPVDILRRAVAKLKECCDKGLRIYAIAGSHDFSPTGKTMLSVLEEAGLIVYVGKFTEENGKMKLHVFSDMAGAKICGVVGKKGALDIEFFDLIDRKIENLPGFKIFMFHAAIAEFRPPHMKDMPAVSLRQLPENFDYYAAGHVHVSHTAQHGKGVIVFPNALFPTEFPELEKYDGGFSLVHVDDSNRMAVSRKAIRLFDVITLNFSADAKSPEQVQEEMVSVLEKLDLANKALLIKINGVLEKGRPIDIDMRIVTNLALEKGAFTVKKSTSSLSSREFEEVRIMENMSTDEIERKLVAEHLDQMKMPGTADVSGTVAALMDVFKEEKGEDETVAAYESKIKENAKKVLGL
ncbi:MAG: exonuclease SbcCD subunit D [Candidatus Aenigmarchaeota archaeon]|nr:exonuclease SbcCD subunit D [Candidatus Aenigmarchaeota archaeon]